MDLCSSLFMVTSPFCELSLGQQMWVFTYCTIDQLQPLVGGGSSVNLKSEVSSVAFFCSCSRSLISYFYSFNLI